MRQKQAFAVSGKDRPNKLGSLMKPDSIARSDSLVRKIVDLRADYGNRVQCARYLHEAIRKGEDLSPFASALAQMIARGEASGGLYEPVISILREHERRGGDTKEIVAIWRAAMIDTKDYRRMFQGSLALLEFSEIGGDIGAAIEDLRRVLIDDLGNQVRLHPDRTIRGFAQSAIENHEKNIGV